MKDLGKGEFVVNVRPWLPEKLRNVVFRDQYVVALVGGGGWGGEGDDASDDRAAGMAAMAGMVRNIKRS